MYCIIGPRTMDKGISCIHVNILYLTTSIDIDIRKSVRSFIIAIIARGEVLASDNILRPPIPHINILLLNIRL